MEQKEDVKKLSVSLYPSDIDFINNLEGVNFSDKIRNLSRSYNMLTGILVKFSKKLAENEIDLNQENITIGEEGGIEYKLNYMHVKSFLKFRKGITEQFGKEFAEEFINKLILNDDLLSS